MRGGLGLRAQLGTPGAQLGEVSGGAQRPEPAGLPLCRPSTTQLCWTRD